MHEDELVGRAMTMKRLTPDEIDRVHRTEIREQVPIDFDAVTQTCSGFKKRHPVCLTSWEILGAFKMAENKFHYGYAGAQGLSDFFRDCWKQILGQVVPHLKVTEHYCRNCHWYQTLFDETPVDGDWIDHGPECFGAMRVPESVNLKTGEVKVPGVINRKPDVRQRQIPNMTAKLCAILSPVNVRGMHLYDDAVGRFGGKLDLRNKGGRGQAGGRASRIMSLIGGKQTDDPQMELG